MAKITKLKNGITCVAEERPGNGLVSMRIRIAYDAFSDGVDQGGLTYLAQEAINGGTTTRSRNDLAETVESKGSFLLTAASDESVSFGIDCLSRETRDLFALLADVIRNPAFDVAEVEKTKTQIIQILDNAKSKPTSRANSNFYEMAFGAHGGRSIMGSEDSLKNFTVAQVKQKYADIISDPSKIVISFAGDISATEAEKLADKYFGDMQATSITAQSTFAPAFIGGDYREETSNDQLNLLFGFEAPSSNDEDRHVVNMLNEILDGGMSSPLFQEVREKRGLVYSVGSSYLYGESTGTFLIHAGTGRGNAGQLMDVTFDLLGSVARDGVSQDSLDLARNRIIRNVTRRLESTPSVCGNNASNIEKFDRIVSLQEYEEKLKQVTSDDICRVLGKMLQSGKYALSAVGPQDSLQTPDEIRALMQKHGKDLILPAKKKPDASVQHAFNAAAPKLAATNVDPQITVLPNGLKIITLERPGTMTCGAWVGAGSDHEPLEINGATHMNEHMMFKGTPSYGPGEIEHIVENELLGGLNAHTSEDHTAYFFYGLEADALEKVTDICSEMVFHANIDHDEFNGKNGNKGERDVVIEEIGMYNDKPSERNYYALMDVAYSGQAHSRPILGTEDTLRKMTVDQLIAYRNLFYAPNNVVFAAIGPVRHEDFVAIVEKKCGHLQRQNFSPLPAQVWKGGTVAVNVPEAPTNEILIAAPAPAITAADSVAYEALAIILGDGFSSRLHRRIVLEQQLAPSVYVGMGSYPNTGLFYISANAKSESAKEIISSAYAELRKATGDITQAEVDKVRVTIEADLLRGMETNVDACMNYAEDTLIHGRVVTIAEQLEEIRKLTVEDVQNAAKQILATNPAVAINVNKKTPKELIPTHQEVLAMRDGKKPPTKTPKPTSLVA